jgi:hypothetical protein
MRLLCFFFACFSAFFSGCGEQAGTHKSPATMAAGLESVDLPQTQVEDQGRFGICWSYGTVGMVESFHKSKTGEDVNISEEAIAFYRLAELVHRTVQEVLSVPDFIEFFTRGINEGFYTRLPESKRRQGPSAGDLDALDLIKKYGLVPEKAWSVKFRTSHERQMLFSTIRSRVLQFTSGKNRDQISLENVIDEVLVGPEAFPSRPPREFLWKGERVTATAFASDVLGFDPDKYEAFETNSENDLPRLIELTKKSLALGVSVPFAYPISVSRIEGDLFSGAGVDPDDSLAFAYDGGHLTLVTDFVNKGSREGALAPEELQRELVRPAEDLSYFVMKNSWGLGEKRDDAGGLVGEAQNGYYKIDRSYLVGAARGSAKGFMNLIVVVPKEVF